MKVVCEFKLASITEASEIEFHCTLDLIEADFVQVPQPVQVPLGVLRVEVVRHHIAFLIMRGGFLVLNIGKFIELCNQFLAMFRVLQTALSKLIVFLTLRSLLLVSLPIFYLLTKFASLLLRCQLGPRIILFFFLR